MSTPLGSLSSSERTGQSTPGGRSLPQPPNMAEIKGFLDNFSNKAFLHRWGRAPNPGPVRGSRAKDQPVIHARGGGLGHTLSNGIKMTPVGGPGVDFWLAEERRRAWQGPMFECAGSGTDDALAATLSAGGRSGGGSAAWGRREARARPLRMGGVGAGHSLL